MNKHAYSIALFAASAFFLVAANAQAVYIPDNYHGDGTVAQDLSPGTNPDVYDLDNQGYDVAGMDVKVEGSKLTVVLNGNYFKTWGNSSENEIFQPGPLFLSTDGWNPTGTATDFYASDNKNNGEKWEYAVTLNNLMSNGAPEMGGTTSLYSTTDGTITSGSLRTMQEAWFTPENKEDALATGSWLLDPSQSTLTITIDLSKTGWDGIQDLGLHWTMACGNDVIEGAYSPTTPAPVPEPATVLLFGAGLIGLAGCARRRNR
ncbi:PEP-CTERM sorting domain-containing protein [Desulfobulbus sp.]|uniref:PEP-CTERM sorting domain-containing protein n=1 Tax=Desulfobulbus sp. TaxID=895 RepID=UPI00286EE340|nr:PEP-CTERM sorting domain-containing protein [Desulfobulbus sp.]